MRLDTFSIDCPAGNGSGASALVGVHVDKWVQVVGSFSMTITFEGTIDGSTWVAITAATAPGLYEIAPTVNLLRCTVSSFVSGSASVMFNGRHTGAP